MYCGHITIIKKGSREWNMTNELQLHPIYQNGAVFQRDIQIPITGKSGSRHLILVEFCGNSAFTRSSNTGNFRLYLPPMKAGGPFEMVIRDLDKDESLIINDIMIGEVWLASGQSNMDYRLNTNWAVAPPQKTFQQEKEFYNTIDDPTKFRFFEVKKNATATRMEDYHGIWKHMDQKNAPEASAVASWFGQNIRNELNVPVGIILSSWGGTTIEAWTSREALLQNPDTIALVKKSDEYLLQKNAWKIDYNNIQLQDFTQEDPGNKGIFWGWAKPEFDDSSWKDMTIPGSWIQQKIAGHGAVWFRKTLDIPEHWIGKSLLLDLGGIDKHDTTFFNGIEIGKTGNGFDETVWNEKRKYPIAAELVNSNKVVIAIRAYSFINEGGFSGSSDFYRLSLESSNESINISGNWKAFAEFDMGIRTVPSLPFGPGNPRTPGILFDDMIHPLIPFPIRGAIWYQGESNAQNPVEAAKYKRKMEMLICDWRFRWGEGNFPFIQVQLAGFFEKKNYDQDSAWAVLRNAQREVCESMPEVYMVTAVDLGDEKDIHPQDKCSVGKRLANCALYHVYHKTHNHPSGPLCKKCCIIGNSLRITFDYADGLTLKPNASKSFYLAGSDRIFYQSDSVNIDGNSIIVGSAQVKHPCVIRYAWANYPNSVLFNESGLPASPFEIAAE